MIKKNVCLGLLLTIFLSLSGNYHSALAANTNSFQVLVDINQIYPSEAEQAAKFAADGVWTIPLNSSGVDWNKTFDALNAKQWIVSEDNPTSTEMVDFVSSTLGRMVDGAMFYNENGIATPLDDSQIAAYTSHIVPGFGPVGNRIILLTRSYAGDDERQAQLDHALENPNVAGATFEFNPKSVGSFYRKNFVAGCKHILDLGKKCYLLMPPSGTTTDYLDDIQRATYYFANGGLLNNPNVYFVVAVYVREYNAGHFLSTDPNDRNSIESVVKWLNVYRGRTPTPTPIPTPIPTRPNLCDSATISSPALSSGSPITVTTTSNKPVKNFSLAFYNLDNLYGPGNPKPIYFEAGKHFILSKEAGSLTQTMNFTITYADINKPDLNNNSQKPTKISVNGYFIDPTTGQTSLPDARCVVQFKTALLGDLNGDTRVDILDYNILVANFGQIGANLIADITKDSKVDIFDYNVLVANFGK